MPPARQRPARTPVTGWLAGKDWTVIPTRRRVVALTFDAGANANAVPSILATLGREGVPATFFLTGNFVATSLPPPGRSRQLASGSATTPSATRTSPGSGTRRCGRRYSAARGRSPP